MSMIWWNQLVSKMYSEVIKYTYIISTLKWMEKHKINKYVSRQCQPDIYKGTFQDTTQNTSTYKPSYLGKKDFKWFLQKS